MGFRDLYRNKWIGLAFWSVLYVLWVIWLGNWYLLAGLAVVFDLHITRKVKWAFWKKEYKDGEKHNELLDWLDALIFALIFVTFVNTFFFQAFKIPSSSMERTLYTGDHLFVDKITFGPKMPQTPLTVPFTHNVIGRNMKPSYSTRVKWNYRRLRGLRGVRRGDCVVFNFPNGDSVLTRYPSADYYAMCRTSGKKFTLSQYGPVVARPSDKKDHYVKRCVAVAGDTLELRDGLVYVNSEAQQLWPGIQYSYTVKTDGSSINLKTLEKIGLNMSEVHFSSALPGYPELALTEDMIPQIEACSNVLSVERNLDVYPPDYPDSYLLIFPFTEDSGWTRDNFGPLWIPKKGADVRLDTGNLPLYERIIRDYEHHDLKVADGRIFIDGVESDSYTFGQDYFFMMGDNRHNSLDSRYWGFVPEDHIVGRPAVIWLSTDENKSFPKNIRLRRFFKII